MNARGFRVVNFDAEPVSPTSFAGCEYFERGISGTVEQLIASFSRQFGFSVSENMRNADDMATRAAVHEEAPDACMQIASFDGLAKIAQELLDALNDDGLVERSFFGDAEEGRNACFAQRNAAFDAGIIFEVYAGKPCFCHFDLVFGMFLTATPDTQTSAVIRRGSR